MTTHRYDVVIIGSGAGGGTAAQALAPLVAAGRTVLVLEKGPRLDVHEMTGREAEMASALYEADGGFLTADGAMTLAFGRAYGGSTVVYTGTTLPAPARVLERWGVPGLTHDDLIRRSRRYVVENGVHLLDGDLLNDNNRLFAEGCAALGWHAEQFALNLRGCLGASLCNLGCPNGAKQGTHVVQLPAAERAGVEVVTRADVLRIDPSSRRLHVRVAEK
ncbi:MAG TPA: GMC family oxidoreductase N-terminal domain-containing protein, partial [Longimicrobiales bacterium]|nr:GMC family oxidoreductase N-terminal domain-containing protein [Longimicrobiales bacterium]